MGPQIFPIDLVWIFFLLHRATFVFVVVPPLALFADQHLADVRRLVEGLAVDGLVRLDYRRQVN